MKFIDFFKFDDGLIDVLFMYFFVWGYFFGVNFLFFVGLLSYGLGVEWYFCILIFVV